MQLSKIDSKFIINLKGKEFVTYDGLLYLAHQLKLKSIETELIQIPDEATGNVTTCIVKAVVTTEDGKRFEGYGDANPRNVNSMIANHIIRMAETRAKARALRDLTNIGMTAIEELGGEEIEALTPKKQPVKKQTNVQTVKDNTEETHKCSECGVEIPSGVATYSKTKFGKELCINCQKNMK